MRLLIAASLVLVMLAGCVDDGTTQSEPTARIVTVIPDQATFLGSIENAHVSAGPNGHAGAFLAAGHNVAQLHTQSIGLEKLDYNDLSDGLATPSSGFTELHVVGDLAVVASLTGPRGATLLNVSDPSNMRVLSHIYNGDDNWDVRISDDGKYLFIGCQGSGAFDCTGVETGETPGTTGGSVCTSIANAQGSGCPGGIAVYDIQDPENPVFIDYLEMGFTHNVFTYTRDHKYYFINAAGNIGEFDPDGSQTKVVSSNVTAVHDIDVQLHPLTNEWILYTGSQHMSMWNVDDPFDPQIIGFVDPAHYNESVPAMWHEQTPMPCLIEGRHLTIGAGESGAGYAQAIGVVDTSDPRNPMYLGKWILPDHKDITGQGNYRFSLHNIDGNCDGQVAIGHYHAGVWVFDVSTYERMLQPQTLAYYLPHEQPIQAMVTPASAAPIAALVTADVPNVWSAQWSDDGKTLFVPDMNTGLYALHPTWSYQTLPAQ